MATIDLNHSGPLTAFKFISRTSLFVALVMSLIFIAMGSFAVYIGERSKNWPTTQGVITGVTTHTERRSGDSSSSLIYDYGVAYTVNGASHTTGQSSATYIRNGDAMTIAYNPTNPDDTVVGASSIPFGYLFAAIGAIMCIGAIVGLVKIGSMKKQQFNQAIFGDTHQQYATAQAQQEPGYSSPLIDTYAPPGANKQRAHDANSSPPLFK